MYAYHVIYANNNLFDVLFRTLTRDSFFREIN